MDFDLLPLAFVVVIIGGMGSLKGALVGSIVVGMIDNFGKALVPELSYFTLFAPMVIVLALKPTGLVWPRVSARRRGWRLPVLVAAGRVPRSSARRSSSAYWVGLLTQMVILAILAMSLDMLLGYTGLPSLGHAGFFGVAAYARGRAVDDVSRRASGRASPAASWSGTLLSRAVRAARLARARRLLPDDHAGARHGAVGR